MVLVLWWWWCTHFCCTVGGESCLLSWQQLGVIVVVVAVHHCEGHSHCCCICDILVLLLFSLLHSCLCVHGCCILEKLEFEILMRLLVWFSTHFRKTMPLKKTGVWKKNWSLNFWWDRWHDFWYIFRKTLSFKKSQSLKILMLSNPNMGRVDSTSH